MVAQAAASRAQTPPPGAPAPGAPAHDSVDDDFFHHRANRGGLRRLIASVTRLADIQFHIWLTEAKLAVGKILLAVGLFGAAALIAILGIIFLFIFGFHLLTDVIGLRPVWAYLVFAVVQLAIAAGLIFFAKSTLSAKTPAKGGK